MAMKRANEEESGLRIISDNSAEPETRLAHVEEQYLEAAQMAAPLRKQLELARELVNVRMQKRVGAGAVIETARMTQHVVSEMMTVGMATQPTIEGLKVMKLDDLAGKLQEVQNAGLEAMLLIHNTTVGALLEQVQQFEVERPEIGALDVIGAALLGQWPGRVDE